MLKQLLLVVSLVSFSFSPLAVRAEEGETSVTAEKIEVTIVGEVINPICYLDHNGRGLEHMSCAESSISTGIPLAILEDDTEFIYLAVTAEHKPANEQLHPFLAQRVQVQGKLMEGNGLTVIEVEQVKLAT